MKKGCHFNIQNYFKITLKNMVLENQKEYFAKTKKKL